MIRSVITMGREALLRIGTGLQAHVLPNLLFKDSKSPLFLAHGVRITGLLHGVLCTIQMPLKRWSPRSSQGEVLRSLSPFSSVGVGELLPWPSK